VAQTIAEVGLERLLPDVFDSAVVGLAKPDPAIFELAAARLGVPLRELVHVGDSESADVAGAHGAGAYAIRFDGLLPNESPTAADGHARTHAELRALLAGALGRPL
jgi:putative hydrolase of the HAD superfamily